MAEEFPIAAAEKAVETLNNYFEDRSPSEEHLFEVFAMISMEHGGEPFHTLPGTFKVKYRPDHPQAGKIKTFVAHAAWFRKEGHLDAFTAAIYDAETKGFYITHDMGDDWPPWLDDYLKQITSHIRFAEMAKNYPTISNALH